MGEKISKWKTKCLQMTEVMEAVQIWLKAMPKTVFLEGIQKVVNRWTKCVAKQGAVKK
jgi:hypothetical protein